MIQVKQIHKYFYKNKKNEIHVLNDLTIEFPKKGLIVLAGPSGSGKTTFLNVIGGLDHIQSGSINFGNREIKKHQNKVWDQIRTEKIGYIFQNYYLIPSLSVYENLAFVLRMLGVTEEHEIEDRVHYVLKAVNMFNFRKRLASQLSGGQQQRVAIARALVKGSSVIIADEPTGNLDSSNTVDVMNIIKKISEDRLVILVTHEKELARFYADRIIEFKDGKIINDYINDSNDQYEIEQEDTLYLKDFSDIDTTSSNLHYYSQGNNQSLKEDVQIRLIQKHDTIYISVKGPYKNIKLVNDDQQVIIKDEHYQVKEKEVFIETSYNLDLITHDHKRKTAVFTFKDNLLLAFKRLLKLGKKGKFMLLGFMISGIVIAFSASIIGNYFFNKEVFVEELENYVYFQRPNYMLTYDTLLALNETRQDEDFFINVYGETNLRISLPNMVNTSAYYTLSAHIDILDHLESNKLMYGRMPQTDYEIVVDYAVFEKSNGDYSRLTTYGIWNYRQLVGEELKVYDRIFTIVGISDTKVNRIYATRDGASLLFYTAPVPGFTLLSYQLAESEVTLIAGDLPEEGSRQLLAPSALLGPLIPENFFANEGSVYNLSGFQISGVYDMGALTFGYTPLIGYTNDVEFYLFRLRIGEYHIYTNDPEGVSDELVELGFTAEWPYQSKVIEAVTSAAKMLPILFVSLFIVVFNALGIYYMTRSSMISRLYEISVYRALGISRSKIKLSFLIEIAVTTTMSSVIGFLLSVIAIYSQQGRSALAHLFHLNTFMIVSAFVFIYLSNMGFGLLSIRGQLRKTPAQLLSQYDM